MREPYHPGQAAVVGEGAEQERVDAWIMSEVARGVALPGLYPMDAETKGRYERDMCNGLAIRRA